LIAAALVPAALLPAALLPAALLPGRLIPAAWRLLVAAAVPAPPVAALRFTRRGLSRLGVGLRRAGRVLLSGRVLGRCLLS
jgi:hypothetical protein